MSTNKIYCFGDGYAHGHIWPEWPQILQALAPEYNTTVHTGIGAGNEYLINLLIEQGDNISNQTVIFQWAQTSRFDKLIEDEAWLVRAKSDPVYHFNLYESAHGTWWLSSASKNKKIQEYHKLFVQNKQENLRFNNQQILVENYLQQHNCKYLFISTREEEQFCSHHIEQKLRGDEVQPSPLLHFYYLTEVILPKLNIIVTAHRYKQLKQAITEHKWKAYDPDRDEIWQKMLVF
jgi:hypothetical protein